MHHTKSAPESNNVRTFYEHPILDRPTGRYTVAWENESESASIRVHNRLTDMCGNLPSLYSIIRLPQVLSSYLRTRRQPLMRSPKPYIVWDAIRKLKTRIGPGVRVFEAGGGNSTLWFLMNGAHVTTVGPLRGVGRLHPGVRAGESG